MILEIFSIIAPILAITMIGYWLGRTRDDLSIDSLGSIVILIATPALIFSTLTSIDISPETLRIMALSAVLSVCVATALGYALTRFAGLPARSFLPPLMFPNSGNIGLPLAMLAFGEAGLAMGVSYFFVIALIQHTVGYSISSGSARFGFLLRQPLIYAVAGVLIVVATRVEVPEVILTTTRILGGMMIPGMLIMLGSALSTLRVSDLRPALIAAIGRLAIGLVAAVSVVTVLGLSGTVAGVVFLMCTMPSAIVTYVFAQRFREDAGQVAGAVLVSTLLTFACLPALLWVALRFAEQ